MWVSCRMLQVKVKPHTLGILSVIILNVQCRRCQHLVNVKIGSRVLKTLSSRSSKGKIYVESRPLLRNRLLHFLPRHLTYSTSTSILFHSANHRQERPSRVQICRAQVFSIRSRVTLTSDSHLPPLLLSHMISLKIKPPIVTIQVPLQRHPRPLQFRQRIRCRWIPILILRKSVRLTENSSISDGMPG